VLQLRGGRMHYLKLIKLLYLVDREALLRWGRFVTTDQFVSMDKGPVVSRIYTLIREEPEPGEISVWRRYISEPQNYEAALLGEAPADELSRAEEDLIAEVFAEHGHKSRWELVQLTHDLPEWRDPEGSAVSTRVIRVEADLRRTGFAIHPGQGPGVLPASARQVLNLPAEAATAGFGRTSSSHRLTELIAYTD